MQSNVDTLWLIVAILLVLAMQAGFLMLEGGRVRAKNSINVAQKNITDLIVAWTVFFVGGSVLMFGTPISALVQSATNATTETTFTPLHFILQVAYCSTAATIVSGAVAERISFRAYLVVTAVITGFIYPIVGRFVWGSTYNPEVTAYLDDIGFVDFAGSTVIHGVGAWVGLVAIMMIGPRLGRFDENGEPQTMPAYNAVIALFGLIILMLGWMGFNGGSVSTSDPRLQLILFNTLASAVFGALAGIILGLALDKGVFNPTRVACGLLGGLVACTASIHVVSVNAAVVIGFCGGAIATYSAQVLLYKFKLDDPLDTVATHGVAGAFGTLAVAFVLPASSLVAGSRVTQLAVQLTGVLSIACFTTLTTFVTLLVLKRFMQIRVPAQVEYIGLNYTEHGESIGVTRLQNALDDKLQDSSSFAGGFAENLDGEHSELASTLNKIIDKYESATEQISIAQERFQQFAETASDWLWEADADLTLVFVHTNSDAYSAKVTESEFVGKNLLDILQITENERQQLKNSLAAGEHTPVFEAPLNVGNVSIDKLAVEIRAIANVQSDGTIAGYRGTITDISLRKSAEDKAIYLSLHDELTGLPNRRGLSIDLKTAMARAEKREHAIVVAGLDLDGFKSVNDAYGHVVGDQLLEAVSTRISQFLRSSDSVYRTGGDEFVIIFDELAMDCVTAMSENVSARLIEELCKHFSIQGLKLQIGASIGLAHYPSHSDCPDNLLRMADLALYAAKEAGKRRAISFSPELDIDSQYQRTMEQGIVNAVDEGQFYLMYQPQYDAMSEQIIGFEALIRWNHVERGEVSPAEFIPLIEKLRLMDTVGTFVLDTACEFAASWPLSDDGFAPTISVNVSPYQFQNPNFYNLVKQTLTRTQLAPERLELEITEEVLIHDFKAIADVLQKLRQLGVGVAIDDFGSGQTSLRYLNQLPISTIKIDRSFIRNLGTSDKASEITRTVVKLGQKLNVNVIAEGVEERVQLAMLRQWQCDQIQGFLFSKPIDKEAVYSTLNRRDQSDKKFGT